MAVMLGVEWDKTTRPVIRAPKLEPPGILSRLRKRSKRPFCFTYHPGAKPITEPYPTPSQVILAKV